eukprot:2067697-Amphidinium_carterae.1
MSYRYSQVLLPKIFLTKNALLAETVTVTEGQEHRAQSSKVMALPVTAKYFWEVSFHQLPLAFPKNLLGINSVIRPRATLSAMVSERKGIR